METGAGAMTARCLADAAGVVYAAARATAGWDGAAGAAAQADALGRRAVALGEDNARCYAAARRALEGELPGGGQELRDQVLGAVVEAAAGPPLELARLGADIADLAAHVAERADGRRVADVIAAAAVAAGAAAASAHLVAINLATRPGDERLLAARAAAAKAAALAAQLLDEHR